MRKPRLILPIMSISVILGLNHAYGGSIPPDYPLMRGLTEREMRPRGQSESEERERRERLRQIRIQESRMPRDIRNVAPTVVTRPGAARPQVISRERVNLVGGGWYWSVDPHGWSYPIGYPLEFNIADPEAVTINKEQPVVEWWETSERSRGQRAEFFRTRFGAASELRATPQQMQGTGIGASMGGGAASGGGTALPSAPQPSDNMGGARPMDQGPPSPGGMGSGQSPSGGMGGGIPVPFNP